MINRFASGVFSLLPVLGLFIGPSRGSDGVIHAFGFLITAALVTAIFGGAAAAATSTMSFLDARKARRKQEGLEKQRAEELSRENAARVAAAERAKTAGRRVGRRSSFLSTLGFGSGDTAPGLGTGNLFGN